MKLLAANPFGNVPPPAGVGSFSGGQVAGIPTLINIGIKTMIVGAGVYTIFNLVLAGYWYLSAAGDSKRLSDASAKIWQSIIGLIVAAGSVMLAGLIGKIFFGNANAILQFQLFTP